MGSPEWDADMAAMDAVCKDAGIEWHELRREVVADRLEEQPWPEGEGLGSSDMNHITMGAWRSDPEGVGMLAQRVAERKRFEAELAEQGISIDALRRLLAPAE